MTERLEKFYTQLDLDGASLAHWGIKGMKWGIRRSDAELARLSGGQTEADDASRARQTQTAISKAKSLSAVSDADLNHLVNRINVEKRYAEATAQASVLKKGSSAIKTVLNIGDTMNKAYGFANSPTGRILANKLGLYAPGPGKHAALPKNVISVPNVTQIMKDRRTADYVGKHRS